MAASSEVEKLERRYAENPDGRFFAPLADAYRKAGNVTRALELVRSGLEKHPDYLSAHIVLGRCLLDQEADQEAAQTFERVLALDSENTIALKSLAEIAERAGRLPEARGWLQKLLMVDAMNTEAEADLQRLGGAIAEGPTQPIPLMPADTASEVSFADVAEAVEGSAESAVEEPAAPPAEAQAPPVEKPAPAAEVTTAPVEPLSITEAATAEMEPLAAAASEPFAPVETEPFARPATQGLPADAGEPQPARPEPAAEPVAERSAEPTDEPVPDRHPLPEELQVADSALDIVPFDDSLAWGIGERASGTIRSEDVSAVGHDESVRSPAGEFLAGFASDGEPAEPLWPPPPEPAASESGAAPASGATAATTPGDVEGVPASPYGAYSLAEQPASAPPEAADEGSGPGGGLPLILPEDVTPPEELARPSARLVQMVSPPPAPGGEGVAGAPEPIVSETLGDLYLRQGFRGEAAGVYRRLLAQRPDDAGLAAKLQALEAPPPDLRASALGAESVRDWLRRIASARVASAAQVPAPVPPPAAPAPGPSPLEEAFAAPAPDPEALGQPAHPAAEAFSLDQIFGSPSDAPPAQPGRPAAEPSPPPEPPAGTSFDDFFGAAPAPGTVRPASPSQSASSPGGEEDLNAFNAWLQGLKR
jgi:hypothetical protein